MVDRNTFLKTLALASLVALGGCNGTAGPKTGSGDGPTQGTGSSNTPGTSTSGTPAAE